MGKFRHAWLIAVVATVGLLLTGCDQQGVALPVAEPSSTGTPTETASPDPAKPELGDLVLSTEGLGELQFGTIPSADNAAVNLLQFDEEACVEEGLPGIWRATYPDIDEGYGLTAPFAVKVKAEGITRIDVKTTQIFTDSGIHIGSSLDEVLGVYSGGPDQVVNHADVSDVYVIKGTKGQLQFEVAVDRIPNYWDPSVIDTVVFLSAIDIGTEPYGVAATDNAIGVCNAS